MLLEKRPRHASFQLQQSAEKLLKAALIARGQKPERTHDLVLLALTLDSTLLIDDCIFSGARLLTLVGTRSRYPDRFVELSIEEIRHCSRLRGWCGILQCAVFQPKPQTC